MRRGSLPKRFLLFFLWGALGVGTLFFVATSWRRLRFLEEEASALQKRLVELQQISLQNPLALDEEIVHLETQVKELESRFHTSGGDPYELFKDVYHLLQGTGITIEASTLHQETGEVEVVCTGPSREIGTLLARMGEGEHYRRIGFLSIVAMGDILQLRMRVGYPILPAKEGESE